MAKLAGRQYVDVDKWIIKYPWWTREMGHRTLRCTICDAVVTANALVLSGHDSRHVKERMMADLLRDADRGRSRSSK